MNAPMETRVDRMQGQDAVQPGQLCKLEQEDHMSQEDLCIWCFRGHKSLLHDGENLQFMQSIPKEKYLMLRRFFFLSLMTVMFCIN